MPGSVSNISQTLATTRSTIAPPIVPEVPAATSVVAEKVLQAAATMFNNILSTSTVVKNSVSSSRPTSDLSTTAALSIATPESSTPSTLPPPVVPEQHAGVFIYGFCLVLIPTATILGNLLVIISVLRFKTLHSAINFLILGLAVADLLVALFVMPYAVYVYVQGGFWFLGPLMCDIYSASDVACSTASILLLAVISFDRYRAVSRPIQYSRQSQNIRRVIIILIGIWLISLALASPIVLGVNHRPPDASPYECRFYNPEFSIGSSIVSFVIPCFVVLFVYIRIMVALRKREKAAKMRRLANQQETNKTGDISTDENDAGQIVAAPAINVLMLALPTIQKRMRRFERHQRAVNEAETKEYDVDSNDDKRSQNLNEEEIEFEDEDESDDEFDDDDFSLNRSNNLYTAKQLILKVGCGIQNLTEAAAAVIGSRHRLSLAEPSLRRTTTSTRKFGRDQASSTQANFIGHSTPQALGISSLMPLLTSHESFRRWSESISQPVRSNSITSIQTCQSTLAAIENRNKISNDLRPVSTSPTTRPETWQTLTPRTSPAIVSFNRAKLMSKRDNCAAKLSAAATGNNYFSFLSKGGRALPRDSIRTKILPDKFVLGVVNLKRNKKNSEELASNLLSPTETTTTTIPAESTTSLTSPIQSSTQDSLSALAKGDQTKVMSHRDKIWEARAKFFRTGNYATKPVLHSKSPLMLRRFVLDMDNDPSTTRPSDEHDIGGNSSSPLSSSDSLSENLHVITNDFMSEVPTSMSRKSSEFESFGLNYSPSMSPTNNNTNLIKPQKDILSKSQDLITRNSVRRFKSFHVNHRTLPLPSVDVSKATELLRNLSRRSPRLFRSSLSPSSFNTVSVNAHNNVDKQPLRKKLSYTSGDAGTRRSFGILRRKSESYMTSESTKYREFFRFPNTSSVRFFKHRQNKPLSIQETEILCTHNANTSSPLRKTSVRYPGTLTSSALCEELDYVDIDLIHNGEPNAANERQRSPVLYSEETTSSATDINFTSPIQSIIAPVLPSPVDANNHCSKPKEPNKRCLNNSASLIIQNQTVAELNQVNNAPHQISCLNDVNTSYDEVKLFESQSMQFVRNHSSSVHFKPANKEMKSLKRLPSAADVLETKKLLGKPPIPTSRSSDLGAVSLKHPRLCKQSLLQKLSNASINLRISKLVDHSVESCYSSSQSQATNTTAGVYANPTVPAKNVDSKLKLVKRAINRKESSLKRKVNKAQRKEKRATKTLGIVVGIFLICWVPFFSINILNAICILIKSPACEVGFSPFFYSTWLGYTNSFVNPIIYGIFNTEFRRAFRSLLVGRTSGRRHRARHV